ncbi:DUF1772 domain-containing protein [Neolewinella aurantiaca]|uniref:DUF1772 domain-containing protein n=1 Tax=Neolewinella aurantiaca TaxID=2602767 RepID=A0A5C7FY77_9BACT|nr:DUF1772 domain-containing protein [Neolewinella aurantiaca]TXF90571.1 DUF1772 domain-containing protein [Neolewinella aurantiaca]
MNDHLKYILLVLFSVFLGSQITEGVLLVPYWQSLPAPDFYAYYNTFGPAIGRFYTVLTVIAALVPIILSIIYFRSRSPGRGFALVSALFAVAFVACFYVYFKEANELFYQAAFNEAALKNELITWRQWHWGRVGLEGASLLFLVLAFGKGE